MMSREIIGIVGSSKAIGHSIFLEVENIICSLPDNCIVVTGDAKGIDFMVQCACLKHGQVVSVIYSKEIDKEAYRKRNQIIADYSDRIISIALPKTKTSCYHCNRNDHERTGGCWTGKMNGNYQVIVLSNPRTVEVNEK